mgnify:CR=1 FL=1
MDAERHDWIVFHRLRFAAPRNGAGRPLPGPTGARAWHLYPSGERDASGLPVPLGAVWGGFALYADREAAEAGAAETDALPWMAEVVERWRALAAPIHHHGVTSWAGDGPGEGRIAAAANDPGGRLVVMTSAGYAAPGPADLPRIRAFIAGVDRSKAFFAGQAANRAVGSFAGVGVDGHDGLTLSLWSDDAAMARAAYREGVHRELIARHRGAAMFDRSSFTRARIVASAGSWDGIDPAA